MEDFEVDFDDIEEDNDQEVHFDDLVEPDFEVEFPGFTEYTTEFSIFGRPVYKIPETGKKYWHHWEIQLFYPVLIMTFITASYFFGVSLVFPIYDNYPILLCILFTLLFGLYISSYVKIILDGPGYFPFCYPKIIPNETMRSGENCPAGIISKEEQHAWAKKQTGPNRCVLSVTAGRYVIKPDHYCTYTACWIGKRNLKFLILFTFWGCAFHLMFLILAFWGMMANTDSVFSFVVLFLLAMVTLPVFGLEVIRFIKTLRVILTNVTSWEGWNDVDKTQYGKGLLYNLQDVFGQKNMLTWLLPISPFGNLSNEDLIKNYDEYNIIDMHMQRKKRRHREKEKRLELMKQQRREKALKKLKAIRDQQRSQYK